jgi:hypothetical protein
MADSNKGFFLRYGAALDFLIGARTKGEGHTDGVQSSFNDYDIQANLGMGYAIPGNKFDMIMDLSINRSLLSINAGTGGDIYNQAIVFNTGITL